AAAENPIGVWIGNYAAKTVSVGQMDVQGMRIGVSSPVFYGQTAESTAEGSLTIEDSYFQTQIGISVATAYTDAPGGRPLKKAVVRSSVFEQLKAVVPGGPSETISMNYGMMPRDPRARDPIFVYDYNKQAGNDFKVYYSLEAPVTVAPCHD